MTKEQLNKLLIAQAEGKTVQVQMVTGEWRDVFVSVLDSKCDASFYRIKPDERFVYKYDDKFVIMDVKIPLIKDSPLFEGSLEECNKWIDEQSEKHYKPFEDTAELMVHYNKHFNIDFPPFYEPIIWVKSKSNDTRYLIIGFEESRVLIGNSWFTMKDLFRQCVFLDNSHCGTLEE